MLKCSMKTEYVSASTYSIWEIELKIVRNMNIGLLLGMLPHKLHSIKTYELQNEAAFS